MYTHLEQKTAQKEKERLHTIHQKLRDQFVQTTPKNIKNKLLILLLVGCGLAWVSKNIFILIIFFILYMYLPFVVVWMIERKRMKLFQKQLLQFFPFVSSVLRSGHTLEKAIDQSCKNAQPPLSQEMGLVQKEMKLGNSFEDSLQNLLRRMPDPNLKMALSAITISRKMGSNLAEAIDHIAVKIQEKEKLKNEIKALTAQGKMQAIVTGLMPVVLIAGLNLVAPGYLSPLFTTTAGKIALMYCMISLVAGALWIYRITNKEYL